MRLVGCELEEQDLLPRIADNYEDSEELWGYDYWSVWEDYYREDGDKE